jgi:DNA-binding beta-propeller fold protein YncE
VANGDDGTVRIFDGISYRLLESIDFGSDADNVRLDAARRQIYIGYGNGALGAINAEGTKLGDIRLDAHPESFQIERNGSRIFVNLPNSQKVAVVDRAAKSVIANWGTGGALANFPMALDEPDHRLFIVCRKPTELVVLDTNTGKVIAKLPAVGDCDDLFYDSALKRLYASGGEGAVSVFQQQNANQYAEIAKVPTRRGARTSFFSPDSHCLYVAARQQGSEPAAIYVYRVQL